MFQLSLPDMDGAIESGIYWFLFVSLQVYGRWLSLKQKRYSYFLYRLFIYFLVGCRLLSCLFFYFPLSLRCGAVFLCLALMISSIRFGWDTPAKRLKTIRKERSLTVTDRAILLNILLVLALYSMNLVVTTMRKNSVFLHFLHPPQLPRSNHVR